MAAFGQGFGPNCGEKKMYRVAVVPAIVVHVLRFFKLVAGMLGFQFFRLITIKEAFAARPDSCASYQHRLLRRNGCRRPTTGAPPMPLGFLSSQSEQKKRACIMQSTTWKYLLGYSLWKF